MPTITVVKSAHNEVVAEGDGSGPYFTRVRVLGKDGVEGGWREILYWDCAEWREEANEAFEAILAVIAKVARGERVDAPEGSEDIVDVVFRVHDKDDGDVFALFPGLPGTGEPGSCACYQHVGQHSSADYAGCLRTSRPAKPAEYAALLKELENIGYRLNVLKRAPRKLQR